MPAAGHSGSPDQRKSHWQVARYTRQVCGHAPQLQSHGRGRVNSIGRGFRCSSSCACGTAVGTVLSLAIQLQCLAAKNVLACCQRCSDAVEAYHGPCVHGANTAIRAPSAFRKQAGALKGVTLVGQLQQNIDHCSCGFRPWPVLQVCCCVWVKWLLGWYAAALDLLCCLVQVVTVV